jgi:hypothetical protein
MTHTGHETKDIAARIGTLANGRTQAGSMPVGRQQQEASA